MSRNRNMLLIIAAFLALDIYYNLTPRLLPLDGVLWVLFACTVFAALYVVARLQRLGGLRAWGYATDKGWYKGLLIGIGIGGGLWLLKYACNSWVIDYRLTEGLHLPDMGWIVLQALVLSFLGSTLNDATVRGYWFKHLGGQMADLGDHCAYYVPICRGRCVE